MMKVLRLVISHFLDPIVIFCMYFMNYSGVFLCIILIKVLHQSLGYNCV